MKNDIPPSGPLTPGESRHLDGELPEVQAKDLERALGKHPARAQRLAGLRLASEIWRQDAQRIAGDVDPTTLADRVLARVAHAQALLHRPVPTALKAYAAAALLMIGVGLSGTLLLNASPPGERDASALRLEDLERAEIDLLAEHPELSPRFTSGSGR